MVLHTPPKGAYRDPPLAPLHRAFDFIHLGAYNHPIQTWPLRRLGGSGVGAFLEPMDDAFAYGTPAIQGLF